MDLRERIQDTLPDTVSSDLETVKLVEALCDKHAFGFYKWLYHNFIEIPEPTKDLLETYKKRHPHGY